MATAEIEIIDKLISVIFIVPLKKIFPTPKASEMYRAWTKDGSIIGPNMKPNPIGPG